MHNTQSPPMLHADSAHRQVLLVNTPTQSTSGTSNDVYIPLAPIFLSAYLRQYGVSTSFLDANALLHSPVSALNTFDDCMRHVLRHIQVVQPVMIGLTCLFAHSLPALIELAENIKKDFPHIFIVIGGMHPTLFARELLEYYPCLDAIVMSEGEVQTLALAQCSVAKSPLDESLAQLHGLAYRVGKDIVVRPKQEYIKTLDTLPVPDYECLDMRLYTTTEGWYNPLKRPLCTPVPIITSRSCPHQCNFCAMNKVMGLRFRARSAKSVLDEITMLYERYGVNYFFIEDDNFTLQKKRAMDICEGIVARNLPIHLDTRSGLMVKTLDAEMVAALAAAGLLRVRLAIESGSTYMRNTIIGKHLPEKKIYEVVELFKAYPHIHVFAFFIIGLPEETEESLQDTYTMLEKLDIDGFNMNFITPYPGTRLFEQCMRDNLFINITPENAWHNPNLWPGGERNIFIKPYALDIERLLEWHKKFMTLHAHKVQRAVSKGKIFKNSRA